ncbi:MAG TPA: hypothetical protein V6D19_03425 [Stenomitos sp.]
MRILVDDHYWEIVDLTWEGSIAVLIEDGYRTHFRTLIPFQDSTEYTLQVSTGDRVPNNSDASWN